MSPKLAMSFFRWHLVAERLTIVIVAVAGGEALHDCIASVSARTPSFMVVRSDGTIRGQDGQVLGTAARPNIPAKRQAALELASTPFVALIEDTVVPSAGWFEAVEKAFNDPDVVGCGGPVVLTPGLPASARALALSDFGKFGQRGTSGPAHVLPGCNFAFRRAAVLDVIGEEGLVDQLVFERLRAAGGRLSWIPDMQVHYAHPDLVGARLSTRFSHGRIYGGLSGGATVARRTVAAGKAVLLPLLLMARSLRHPGSAKHLSLATLGSLLLQHGAWAAGEFTGAVFGVSDKGLDAWH